VASPAWRGIYIRAISREIRERTAYLGGMEAATLYLGGGTPSALSPGELGAIIALLERQRPFARDAERTIEVNPEDISEENLDAWRSLGFNRLSVGVQSFSDNRLREINRRHTARQAIDGILLAAARGFSNISADLITGLPGQSDDEARRDLQQLTALPVSHASVYLLSIDPGTLFEVKARRGDLSLPDDDELTRRFTTAREALARAGFDHYEISNFARPGSRSRHNASYWRQRPYIGFGPSAHSYDGTSRQWNIAHVKRYAEALEENLPYFERELLSPADRYNEYVMTALRTSDGVSLHTLRGEHAPFFARALPAWERLLSTGILLREGDRLRATEEAWLISDAFLPDLFHEVAPQPPPPTAPE
jgi:oxygen-independent coproporphyrinogen-3 oxidase